MSRNGSEQVVRRNIELSLQASERIDRLAKRLEANSASEVLRRALKVLEELLAEEDQGKKIQLRGPNGEVETVRLV